jgi:hypothetical protein
LTGSVQISEPRGAAGLQRTGFAQRPLATEGLALFDNQGMKLVEQRDLMWEVVHEKSANLFMVFNAPQ